MILSFFTHNEWKKASPQSKHIPTQRVVQHRPHDSISMLSQRCYRGDWGQAFRCGSQNAYVYRQVAQFEKSEEEISLVFSEGLSIRKIPVKEGFCFGMPFGK
jgi:hypothetical protein